MLKSHRCPKWQRWPKTQRCPKWERCQSDRDVQSDRYAKATKIQSKEYSKIKPEIENSKKKLSAKKKIIQVIII